MPSPTRYTPRMAKTIPLGVRAGNLSAGTEVIRVRATRAIPANRLVLISPTYTIREWKTRDKGALGFTGRATRAGQRCWVAICNRAWAYPYSMGDGVIHGRLT